MSSSFSVLTPSLGSVSTLVSAGVSSALHHKKGTRSTLNEHHLILPLSVPVELLPAICWIDEIWQHSLNQALDIVFSCLGILPEFVKRRRKSLKNQILQALLFHFKDPKYLLTEVQSLSHCHGGQGRRVEGWRGGAWPSDLGATSWRVWKSQCSPREATCEGADPVKSTKARVLWSHHSMTALCRPTWGCLFRPQIQLVWGFCCFPLPSTF